MIRHAQQQRGLIRSLVGLSYLTNRALLGHEATDYDQTKENRVQKSDADHLHTCKQHSGNWYAAHENPI